MQNSGDSHGVCHQNTCKAPVPILYYTPLYNTIGLKNLYEAPRYKQHMQTPKSKVLFLT